MTTPRSNSSTTPSENISVWMPRSRFSVEEEQHRVRDLADAHLQRRAVLDEVGDVPADGPGLLAHLGPALRQLEHRPVDLDDVREAGDVDEGVARATRGIWRFTSGDDGPRALGRGLGALDADAVRAEAVLVRRRDVEKRHVHGQRRRVRDEPRDLGEEDRDEVGAALVHGLADVVPGEERPVAEGCRRTAGPCSRRSRRSGGAMTSTSRSSSARPTMARISSSGLLQPACIQTWSPERTSLDRLLGGRQTLRGRSRPAHRATPPPGRRCHSHAEGPGERLARRSGPVEVRRRARDRGGRRSAAVDPVVRHRRAGTAGRRW